MKYKSHWRATESGVAISESIAHDVFVLYKFVKQPAVYITTNKKNDILYTGVTSNLIKRIYQHKNENIKGFSKNIIVKY